mmetsp:Transcript_120186/g.347313  ORF Transcript_120186/g.347313 Transcript_120186/m.347313 type:complete len:325 (-) Transcript_120186:114-1088(-)
MAEADMTDEKKDAACVQLLSMTGHQVEIEGARVLLEAVGWDVQVAFEQLCGPGESRPTTAPTAVPHADLHRDAEFLAAAPLVGNPAASMSVDSEEDALMEDRARGEPFATHAFDGVDDQEAADAHLAAVIEASYRDQTESGRAASEEELLAEALKISQQQEDARQRQALREQQEAELAESMLMDRMREEQELLSRKEAEEAVKAVEMQRREEQAQREEEEARVAQELEAKRKRLPEEPAAAEPGRIAVMVRQPGGQRLQRAFRSSDTVGSLYDFVDVQSAELAGQRYRLVQTMPRKAFEDRQQTLLEAGVQNQCALMVEVSTGS